MVLQSSGSCFWDICMILRRWEKYKNGGWIVLAFSSPKAEFTDQSLIEFKVWCNIQSLNVAVSREGEGEREREREREREDTKQLYRFLPQSGSSHVPPCTSKESSLKSISNYNCSSTKTRDFKLLKHKSKRFPMLKHKRKRLHMLKHKSKKLLFRQNYTENCLRVEHFIYYQWCSQIQIR